MTRVRGALSSICLDRKTVIGLTTCLVFVACVFNENLPIVLTAGLMLLASIIIYGRELSVRISGFHIYILAFTAYTYLSALWATDRGLTVPKGNALFFIFILMVFLSIANIDERSVERMLKSLMYGGYLTVVLFIVRYGVSGLTSLADEEARANTEMLNANMLGMVAAYAVVINIYLIFCINRKLKILDILILPMLAVIFITGSRKALLIAVLGILGTIFVRNYRRRRRDITFTKWVIILAVIIAAVIVLLQMPAFSGLMKRITDVFEAAAGGGTRGENSAWLRMRYTELGFDLFRSNPLGGVGIGNANHYTLALYGKDHFLHNNFAEMLGCGGIVGFALYYSIYVYLFAVLIKYRKYRTAEYGLVTGLLIIWLIMDVGMVKYFYKSSYFYLFLFWLEAERLKRNAAGVTGRRFFCHTADVTGGQTLCHTAEDATKGQALCHTDEEQTRCQTQSEGGRA